MKKWVFGMLMMLVCVVYAQEVKDSKSDPIEKKYQVKVDQIRQQYKKSMDEIRQQMIKDYQGLLDKAMQSKDLKSANEFQIKISGIKDQIKNSDIKDDSDINLDIGIPGVTKLQNRLLNTKWTTWGADTFIVFLNEKEVKWIDASGQVSTKSYTVVDEKKRILDIEFSNTSIIAEFNSNLVDMKFQFKDKNDRVWKSVKVKDSK